MKNTQGIMTHLISNWWDTDKDKLQSEHGYLGALEVVNRVPNVTGSVNVNNRQRFKMDINEFHCRLGHPNYQVTKKTDEVYDMIMTGTEKKCQNCDISKIHIKILNKTNPHKSTIRGERIYTDISSVKDRRYGGIEYWILIEDEATRMKWSIFIKKKSEMGEKLAVFIQELEI